MRAANASTATRMTDGIFMDRISGGIANRKYRQALRHKLSRNYRIVPDRRKGQSAFTQSAATRRTRAARRVDTFSSRLREQKFPACELNYFALNGGALFRGPNWTDGDIQSYRRVARAAPLPFQRGSGALGSQLRSPS